MSLLGPDDEDIKKIHSEINQIVNQRFYLLTVAITAFGVILSLIIPREHPTPGSEVDPKLYLLSILILIVFSSIYYFIQRLVSMLRIFSSYLITTCSSNWEKDWSKYRNKFNYIGYTKPQTGIFILFGVIATILPFLILSIYSLKLKFNFVFAFFLVSCIGYFCFVIWGYCGLTGKEKSIEKNWEALRDSND